MNKSEQCTKRHNEIRKAEEFENFVGSEEELDPSELCRHCHDYPCSCSADDLMLHDDWDAEIDAQFIRNQEKR